MIRVTSPPRVALGLGAIAAAICLAACGDWRPGVTGPARAAFQFRLQPTVADNAADAYARVDAAHVTVSQAGDMLLDTTAAFRDGAGAGPTFSLRSRNPDDAFVLTTQLLTHGYVVLEGSAQARLRRARTTSVPITFAPVIAALMSPSEVLLTALEDTLRLRGAAVLVTGDTVRGAAVTWVGDGGGVIRVTADGLITALTEGEAQVSATYERLSRTTSVRVRAIVAGVDLAIDTCSMMVGETRVLTARARDRNGNELRRPITWSSGNPAVASVDANGVVTAVAAGTVTIAATSEGRSAGAVVSVRAVPIAVLEVAPAKAELLIDESRPMTARALDADGNVLTV